MQAGAPTTRRVRDISATLAQEIQRLDLAHVRSQPGSRASEPVLARAVHHSYQPWTATGCHEIEICFVLFVCFLADGNV